MRVGGNLHISDFSTNEGIAVFLDAEFNMKNENLDTNYQSTCVSSTSSSKITCQFFNSDDTNDQYYYYPIMRRIIINSPVVKGEDFNHYVIV